jgi:hypothetical protein
VLYRVLLYTSLNIVLSNALFVVILPSVLYRVLLYTSLKIVLSNALLVVILRVSAIQGVTMHFLEDSTV